MPKVECGINTCRHNTGRGDGYGYCNLADITLKWRFAADMGRGSIVCVECLQMKVGKDDEDPNHS